MQSKQQYAEITALRSPAQRIDRRLSAVYRECEDAVLHRLDLAFAAFFRRCRHGEQPGFPRFKPASRWHQLEFPHGNRALRFNDPQQRVSVPGVGAVKLRKGRSVPPFARAWLVQRNGRWYGCFECERAVQPLPRNGRIVGVDRGVHVLAALSDGTLLPVACATAAIGCVWRPLYAWRDHAHKLARRIVDGAAVVALERLKLRAMTASAKGTVERPGRNVAAKSALNRRVLDAGFGLLRQLIVAKAEEAALTVVEVDARFSSQTCSRCGHVARGSRRRRRFCCVACGCSVHADVNAALVIRRRAQLALKSEPIPAEEAGRRTRCAA